MGQAIFIGASAAFFTVYLLIAEAMGFLGESSITAINAPEAESGSEWSIFGFSFTPPDALLNIQQGFELMGRFFQLLTFQQPGLEEASLITALIFVPLSFINGFIIFRAIRG